MTVDTRLSFPNLPTAQKGQFWISVWVVLHGQYPRISATCKAQNRKKLYCGHGKECSDLLCQSDTVYQHVDSANQRKGRGWLPTHWFSKKGCLYREMGQFKLLDGLSNRTECACATLTILRSHCVFTQRWNEKSTYREKWCVKLEASHHKFSYSIPSWIKYKQR